MNRSEEVTLSEMTIDELIDYALDRSEKSQPSEADVMVDEWFAKHENQESSE